MKSAHTHTQLHADRFDVVLGPADTNITPRTKPSKKRIDISPFQYLSIAGDVGFAVVVPIVLAFIFGPQLDIRWGTGHVATVVLVSMGLFIAVFSTRRRIKDIVQK